MQYPRDERRGRHAHGSFVGGSRWYKGAVSRFRTTTKLVRWQMAYRAYERRGRMLILGASGGAEMRVLLMYTSIRLQFGCLEVNKP
jgi:hypothetical protein